MALLKMPQLVSKAAESIAAAAVVALKTTPYILSMKDEAAASSLETTREGIVKAVSDFEADEAKGLPKLRATVLAALKRHPNVPYFLGTLSSTGSSIKMDFETALMGILNDTTLDKTRTLAERTAAAKSLISFKGRLTVGDDMIKRAVDTLTQERVVAPDNKSREAAESVLAILGGESQKA